MTDIHILSATRTAIGAFLPPDERKAFAGQLRDEHYDEKELAMALAGLPSVPEPA